MTKRPIDVIRGMNPGVDIPTGAEMAARLGAKHPEDGKLVRCPYCAVELLESDTHGQTKHMDENHPENIADK